MAKSITIYGIKNCDTMKKARAWLDKHGVAYVFHDYKSEGSTAAGSKAGPCGGLGNAAQPGWHHVPKALRQGQGGVTEKKAIALMLDQPSMIKRPVLDLNGKLVVGFKPEIYEKALG